MLEFPDIPKEFSRGKKTNSKAIAKRYALNANTHKSLMIHVHGIIVLDLIKDATVLVLEELSSKELYSILVLKFPIKPF